MKLWSHSTTYLQQAECTLYLSTEGLTLLQVSSSTERQRHYKQVLHAYVTAGRPRLHVLLVFFKTMEWLQQWRSLWRGLILLHLLFRSLWVHLQALFPDRCSSTSAAYSTALFLPHTHTTHCFRLGSLGTQPKETTHPVFPAYQVPGPQEWFLPENRTP